MASYKKLMIGMVCATAVGASACYGETFSKKLDACFEEHRAEIQKRIKEWRKFNQDYREYDITVSELADVVRNAYDRTCRLMELMSEWHLEFFDYFKKRLPEYNEGRKERMKDEVDRHNFRGYYARKEFKFPIKFFIDDLYIKKDPETGEDVGAYGEDEKNKKLYESYLKEFFIEKGCEFALKTLRDMIEDFAPKGIPCERLKEYANVCEKLLDNRETLRKIPSLKTHLEEKVCRYLHLVQSATNKHRIFLYTENDRYAVERIDWFFDVISLSEIMWKGEGPSKTCSVSKLEDVPEGFDAVPYVNGKGEVLGWDYTLDITWYVQHGKQCNLYRNIFRKGYFEYAKYNPKVVEQFEKELVGFGTTFPLPPLAVTVNGFDKKGMCDALLDEALCDWLIVKSHLGDLIHDACCGYKQLKDRLWLLEAQGWKAPIDRVVMDKNEVTLRDYVKSGGLTEDYTYFNKEIIKRFNGKFINRAEEAYNLLRDLRDQFENNKIKK